MLCRNPYVTGKVAYGCGQCLPCRINKRREWQHRILLEDISHELDSAFITLTYDDEHLPEGGTLVPQDAKRFIRQWVKRVGKTRYFTVGEYGDQTERPHYHIVLFGRGTCDAGGLLVGCTCGYCDNIRRSWRRGHIHCGTLTKDSASYVGGYVTKKLTRKEDERLHGRHPEFARMSLKPGIGARAMDDVASSLLRHGLEETQEDVPLTLRHGSKEMPLGRYLRGQLRLRIGREKETPKHIQQRYTSEMSGLYIEATKADPYSLENTTKFKEYLSALHGHTAHKMVKRKEREKRQI